MLFASPRLNLSRREWIRSTVGASVALASSGIADRALATTLPQLKVGCSARSFYKLLPSAGRAGQMSVADFIQKSAAWHCDCVELQDTSLVDTNDETLMSLKSVAVASAIEFSALSVYTDFIQPKKKLLDQEISRIRTWIDRTVTLGASMLVVFPGSGKKGISVEQAVDLVATGLKELASYAVKSGVVIALENHGMFIESADAVLAVAEKVQHPNVGINLDTGNFRSNYYENIRLLAPKAVNCHVKLELGKGKRREPADLQKTVAILRESNFQGRLVLQYELSGNPLEEVPRYLVQLKALATANGQS